MTQPSATNTRNVLGGPLQDCSHDPLTGFHRDGCCRVGPQDHGVHAVCASVTAEFLDYSKSQGNDLMTPMPEYGFPGLKAGDRWCVCAGRWQEALRAGVAPPVDLEATSEAALAVVTLADLQRHRLSQSGGA